ncbi:hypothetical protein PG984_002692 [Apiospora sp. TS-2023a]
MTIGRRQDRRRAWGEGGDGGFDLMPPRPVGQYPTPDQHAATRRRNRKSKKPKGISTVWRKPESQDISTVWRKTYTKCFEVIAAPKPYCLLNLAESSGPVAPGMGQYESNGQDPD